MRDAMNAFLQREPGSRPALLPAMERLAARVGGLSYQAMTADSSHWSGSLSKTGKLLETDGLIVGFDITLAAENCGAQVTWEDDHPALLSDAVDLRSTGGGIAGRLQTAADTLHRLIQSERADFACVAAMTGPLTLAAQLAGAGTAADLKQISVEIVETLCSIQPDLLLFREGNALTGSSIGLPQRKAFNTLCNVAGYFNIPTALYVEAFTQQTLTDVDKLKLDFYFFGEAAGASPEPAWFSELAQRVGGLGIALPFSDRNVALTQAEQYRNAFPQANLLFTSAGELSRDTDLDVARTVVKELHGV